jgi:hypothetical protein
MIVGMTRRQRFALAYAGWAVVCACLFAALDPLEDPSRPDGRVLSTDAGALALSIARQHGYRGSEVVHVGRGRAGEGAAEDRWIVLLDTQPHSGFEHATVVELNAADGRFLRMRPPQR